MQRMLVTTSTSTIKCEEFQKKHDSSFKNVDFFKNFQILRKNRKKCAEFFRTRLVFLNDKSTINILYSNTVTQQLSCCPLPNVLKGFLLNPKICSPPSAV